jgi:uncharacterized protein YraI
MKKFNLTVIAAIIATFVISMIAFQPTATEASNGVEPNVMKTPYKSVPKIGAKPRNKNINRAIAPSGVPGNLQAVNRPRRKVRQR